MFKTLLTLSLLCFPTLSLAGINMIVTRDATVRANTRALSLSSVFQSEASAPLCLLKYESQDFDRTLKTGSLFEVRSHIVSGVQKTTPAEMKEQLAAHLNIHDVSEQMTIDEMSSFVTKKYGIKVPVETYKTTIELKSKSSGSEVAIECHSGNEQTARNVLKYLLLSSPIVPITDL